jgi:hypothetical protein
MRQALIDDIRNLYKSKIYVEGLPVEEVLNFLSKKFGIEKSKISSIVKSCNL